MAVMVVILIIGAIPALTTIMTNNIDTRVGAETAIDPVSYTIYKDGDYTCLKNGTTNRIEVRNHNTTTVISAALENPGKFYIAAGDYELWGDIKLRSDICIQGAGVGATTIKSMDENSLFYSEQILLTSATDLDVNAPRGSLTLTVDNASELTEGMYIKIVSERTIADLNRGEINQIRSITGNVLTLVRSIDDDYYTTDPTHIRGIGFTENVTFSGLNIIGPGTATNSVILDAVNMYGVHVESCRISEGGETGLRFTDCYAAWVNGCIFENIFYTGLGYSVSIVDCSEGMKITENIFRFYGRHYIATGTYTETTDYPGGMYRDLYIAGNTFESSQIGNEAINNHACSYGSMIVDGNTFRSNGKGIEPANCFAVISNNYFVGNGVGVDCSVADEARQILISNNIFNEHSGTNKAIYIATENITVQSNTFYNSRIVLIEGAINTIIQDNLFESFTTSSAIDAGTTDGYIYNIKIEGNSFRDCGSTSSYYVLKIRYVQYLTIQDNNMYHCARFFMEYCDYLTISGNYIVNGVHHGMEIAKSKNITVTNNVIRDCSGTRGLSLTGAITAATPVFISGNSFISGTTKYYNDGSYTNVRLKNNDGYRSESSGVATILNGTTYITVTHGLSGTPTKIIVTGSSADTVDCYVSNIGSSTFRINVPSTLSSGDKNVYWYAEV